MNKINLFIAIAFFSLWGCNKSVELNIPETSEMYEVSGPVYINTEGSDIYLNGFFKQVEKIDSVILLNYSSKLSEDKKWIHVSPIENTPALEKMDVYIDGYDYSIILLYEKKINYSLTFDPKGINYQNVQIAGSFNSWTPSEKFIKDGEIWKTTLVLSPGKYQYQLVVDGKWMLDPGNAEQESNNIGGFNSIITITDPSENAPKLYTQSYSSDNIIARINSTTDQIVCLWDNYTIPFKIVKNTISIQIPKNAKKLHRQF